MKKTANIKNECKVPEKQWRKWSEFRRRCFNKFYLVMQDKWAFSPDSIKPKAYKVVQWNAAWVLSEEAEIIHLGK